MKVSASAFVLLLSLLFFRAKAVKLELEVGDIFKCTNNIEVVVQKLVALLDQ
eukprot:Pgem_evm1s17589